jgi:hypothetical protein
MHRDWRFWTGALLMAAALAVFIFIGGVASVPWSRLLSPEVLLLCDCSHRE